MLRKIRHSAVWILLLVVALLIPKPKGRKDKVRGNVIRDILREAFGQQCTLFLVDTVYRVPSLESFKKFLKEDKTDQYKYVSEFFDCDDYMFRLMGQFSIPGWADISFGMATSEVHGYNCLIAYDEEGKMGVYIVEPQTDSVTPAEEKQHDKAYKTIFCMM